MDINEKMELFAEILEMEADELNKDALLEDLDAWDSLAKLLLISAMETHFQKTLTADDMRKFCTVKDVLDCMV